MLVTLFRSIFSFIRQILTADPVYPIQR